MEVKEMKELIAAVSAANVDEFEYNNEEFSIRIAKKKAKIATVDASVAGVQYRMQRSCQSRVKNSRKRSSTEMRSKHHLLVHFMQRHQKEQNHSYPLETKLKRTGYWNR